MLLLMRLLLLRCGACRALRVAPASDVQALASVQALLSFLFWIVKRVDSAMVSGGAFASRLAGTFVRGITESTTDTLKFMKSRWKIVQSSRTPNSFSKRAKEERGGVATSAYAPRCSTPLRACHKGGRTLKGIYLFKHLLTI